MFIEVMKNVLFSPVNAKSCDLYYCVWCCEFNKKSKFKLFDENNTDEDDQTSLFFFITFFLTKIDLKHTRFSNKSRRK